MRDAATRLPSNLLKTVHALGFPVDVWDRVPPRIVAAAPPEKLAMGRAYREVNDKLRALLRQGPVRLQHVTGEARALADPSHRFVLRKAAEMGQPGELGCHFQYDGRPTALEFVKRERIHWGPASWENMIDLLGLLAEGAVKLYVLAKPQQIHFSLFGDSHVLLQDQHAHPTERKWVWFIDCPNLVKHLLPQVEALFAGAVCIPALSFDNFLASLYDFETVSFAQRISTAGENSLMDESASDLSSRQRLGLTLLRALGFVGDEDPGREGPRLSLTEIGTQWLGEVIGKQE